MRILIVGAGIAGLALAKALELRGIVAEVIEQRSDANTSGAGLYMPGNTTRAIGKLGLMPELLEAAVIIERQRFLDERGRALFEVDVDKVWRSAGACMSAPRKDIHAMLMRSLRASKISYGRRMLAVIRTLQGKCWVSFDDGDRAEYDLVVGADGINSTVRTKVISPELPRYSGFICWRYITANNARIKDWTVMLGGDRTLLAIPVSDKEIYVYADLLSRGGRVDTFGPSDIPRLFDKFEGPATSLLASAEQSTIHSGRIDTVKLGNWAKGRVVLIGDAAHASSPSMAKAQAWRLRTRSYSLRRSQQTMTSIRQSQNIRRGGARAQVGFRARRLNATMRGGFPGWRVPPS